MFFVCQVFFFYLRFLKALQKCDSLSCLFKTMGMILRLLFKVITTSLQMIPTVMGATQVVVREWP